MLYRLVVHQGHDDESDRCADKADCGYNESLGGVHEFGGEAFRGLYGHDRCPNPALTLVKGLQELKP